ncbi:MAG: sugar phosphate isomerase/epimerase [Chloroflexota bacterium]|nr:sugar phosphate isomerase/epimerase [Chloroflexota bacterium]
MATLAVSTMWGAQGRYADLGDMVDGVREAGGKRIEINYMPTRAQLEQLLARPDLVVSSVHNICPRPTDAAGQRIADPSLIAIDDAERQHAVALTKATMDLARRLGSDAIVVHAGELTVLPEEEKRLDELFRAGAATTDEFATVRERIIAARHNVAGPALERLIASLRELAPYAEAIGIRLGLESRQDYRDIPILDDCNTIFGSVASPMVGYWHDTGHAQRQANLGYTPHEAWLQQLGHRLVGFHLHDCLGLRDHLIPGRGRVDFATVVSYLRTDTIPACEFDYGEEVADIRAGLDYLRAVGFERVGWGGTKA